MPMVTLTKDNFEATVAADGIVLVDCWAGWCAACEGFSRVFDEAAVRYAGHVFARLDTQAERDLASLLGIKNLPTLLIYRDGVLLFQQAGNFDDDSLQSMISQSESVDMELVRAQMASPRSADEDESSY